MGLDGVEILMRVEEAFGVEINEREANEIRTPRGLIDLIAAKLASAPGSNRCLSQRAFYQFRKGLVEVLDLPRNRIRPESKVSDLIPVHHRRSAWQLLRRQPNLSGLPDLAAGWPLAIACAVVACAASIVARAIMWPDASSAWTMILGLILWPVAFRITQSFHTLIPAGCETAGLVAEYLSTYHPRSVVGDPSNPGRDEIARTVRAIVSDQLGIKEFAEDADFVHDLGMD